MEHVGWDYGEEKESEKFKKGINNLKKCLRKDGQLLVTMPLFYRSDLSDLIINKAMPFTEEYFMKRVSFWNEWVQINHEEAIKGARYDSHYANANVLYIGFYKRSKYIISKRY